MVKIAGATSTKNPYGLVPLGDVSCGSNPVPLVPLRKALVPPWFKEMEPRYIASRVARNSAISTRYLAAFAAICLVSTIVLSIGALMLSTFSDDQIARAICICLDVCFLHISLVITGVIVDMLQLAMVPMLQLLLKTRC